MVDIAVILLNIFPLYICGKEMKTLSKRLIYEEQTCSSSDILLLRLSVVVNAETMSDCIKLCIKYLLT